jgi:hypothetical protein
MKTKEKIRRELKKILANEELVIDFNQFIEKNDEDVVNDAVFKTIAILEECDFAFHLTAFRTKNGQKAIKINVESESSLHQIESMEYCDFEMLVESWAKPNDLKELIEALEDGVLFELGDDEELIKETISHLENLPINFGLSIEEDGSTSIVPESYPKILFTVFLSDEELKSIVYKSKWDKKNSDDAKMTTEVKYRYKGEEFDFAVLVDEDRYVFLSKDRNKLLIVNKQGEVTEFVDLNSKNE